MKWLRRVAVSLAILVAGPLAMAASGDVNTARDWRTASRESAGLAPPPSATPEAVVQVYGARAFGWRGAVAVHTWIAVKPENADGYTTYEVMGWHVRRGGRALQVHNGGPDRYWYGARPELYAELRGAAAAEAIPRIEAAVADYPYADRYTTWPGPNSNTFTAHVARAVPALRLDLPPTAIGKDFIAGGAPVARPPSGTGVQLSLFGLAGVIVSAEEGLELNLLGLAFGVDPKSLALRLPGVGIVGF
jgi:hypothetical protein